MPMSRAGPRRTPAELFRGSGKPGAEPQSHIIGDPQTGLVHQDRLQQLANFLLGGGPVIRSQRAEKILGEGIEPGVQAGLERGRPRNDRDLLALEAGSFELLLLGTGGGAVSRAWTQARRT